MRHSIDELVSVIVPVYNTCSDFLSECFESVRNQKSVNVELVIVNDGSTEEETNLFCRQYAEKHRGFVIYIEKQNQGVSVARKTGLEHSGGKSVMFLDSDDSLMPDAIRRLLEVLIKQEADAVIGEDYVRNDFCAQVIYEKEEILKALLDNREASFGWALWAKLFDADCMKKYYRAYPDIYYGEDLLVNAEFFRHADRVVIINEKVYNYRADNQVSATHQKITPKKLSLIKMWAQMEKIYISCELFIEAKRIRANYYDSVLNGLIECEYYHYEGYRKLTKSYRDILKNNIKDIKNNEFISGKHKYIIAIYAIWLFKLKRAILKHDLQK